MTLKATLKRTSELAKSGWVVLLLVLASCSGSSSDTGIGWTHYLGDAARAGVANVGPSGQPTELWRFSGPCGQPPIVVGETAFAACRDGSLYALSVTDGSEIWRFDTDQSFGGGLSAADGLIYAADDVGELYAVDMATGDEAWKMDAQIGTAPAVAAGLLTVGTADGMLMALDAETGEEQWRFRITDTGELRNTAMANGLVYIGSTAAGLTAVDAETGQLSWRADTGGPTGSVRVIDGIAYVGSSGYSGTDGDGRTTPLSAFDAENGDLLWRREPLFPPAVLNGVGYSGSEEGDVYAFDTSDGSEVWTAEADRVTQAPVVAGEVVYVLSDGDQRVYALDAATGDQLWQYEVSDPNSATIAVADRRLYVTTRLGELYAIGGTDD
jgi:eukaryotic-like serine/threonine-protein kinase